MRVYHEALIRCAAALQIAVLDHAYADEMGNEPDEKTRISDIRVILDQANKELSGLRRAVASR